MEEARDLRHRAKILRDALALGKAQRMSETGLGVTGAKMHVEASPWYAQALNELREAEKARDLAVARADYIKHLREDAILHGANRRAEMRL